MKYEEDSFSHTELTAIRPDSMEQSCPFVLIYLLVDQFFGEKIKSASLTCVPLIQKVIAMSCLQQILLY